jgi:hypothetical protein
MKGQIKAARTMEKQRRREQKMQRKTVSKATQRKQRSQTEAQSTNASRYLTHAKKRVIRYQLLSGIAASADVVNPAKLARSPETQKGNAKACATKAEQRQSAETERK